MILIQNPPCVPVVLVAYLLSLCNGSRICIDWHNLGFSMFLTDQSTVRAAIEGGALGSLPAAATR